MCPGGLRPESHRPTANPGRLLDALFLQEDSAGGAQALASEIFSKTFKVPLGFFRTVAVEHRQNLQRGWRQGTRWLMVHRERRMSRGFQGIGNALQLDVEKPQNKGAHTLVNAA